MNSIDRDLMAEQGGAPSLTLRTLSCGSTLTVSCATGVFRDGYTDISITGRGAPLNLTRTYSSARAGQDSPHPAAPLGALHRRCRQPVHLLAETRQLASQFGVPARLGLNETD